MVFAEFFFFLTSFYICSKQELFNCISSKACYLPFTTKLSTGQRTNIRCTCLPNCNHAINYFVEAFVAERLTSPTSELEVWGSSLARPDVSLDNELYSTLFLLTLAPVVQKLDSPIDRINRYPVDKY